MQFYIQLEQLGTSFRLQSDKKNWRLIDKNNSLVDSDYLSSDRSEVIRLQPVNVEMEINGNIWKVNPRSGWMANSQELFSNVYLKRSSFPTAPDKKDLISTIRGGDDSINNSLILNVDGKFELRNPDNRLYVDDPTIVYRYETFCAGNDDVGWDASEDTGLINSIYSNAMKYWLMHLKSRKTNFYMDESNRESPDKILQEIEELKLSWKVS